MHETKGRSTLVCVECRTPAPADARGWQAHLTNVEPAEVGIYCPDCAAREFGRPPAESV